MSEAIEEKKKVQVWIHLPEGGSRLGKVLLLKMRPERGGVWQPVTGSVEPGEAIEDAALREAREESGLRFDGPPVPLRYEFTFEHSKWGKPLRFRESCFRLEAPRGAGGEPPSVTLDSREHVSYRWMAPDDAFALLGHPSNAEALRILIDSLDG